MGGGGEALSPIKKGGTNYDFLIVKQVLKKNLGKLRKFLTKCLSFALCPLKLNTREMQRLQWFAKLNTIKISGLY